MDWTWDAARDWYASYKTPPDVPRDSFTERIEHSYAMMVALIDQIRNHPYLSQSKPGAVLHILTLIPPKAWKRIYVAWDNDCYGVELDLSPEDPDKGFPDGRVYASPAEVISVLERFAEYVESHPDLLIR